MINKIVLRDFKNEKSFFFLFKLSIFTISKNCF